MPVVLVSPVWLVGPATLVRLVGTVRPTQLAGVVDSVRPGRGGVQRLGRGNERLGGDDVGQHGRPS